MKIILQRFGDAISKRLASLPLSYLKDNQKEIILIIYHMTATT